MKKFWKFNDAIDWTKKSLLDYSYEVHTEKWQGKEIKDNDMYRMIEILNHSFSCAIDPSTEELKKQIAPNLPWADDHFLERVGGVPLNPGNEYKNWPYYKHNKSNDQFRTQKGEIFSHSYMERIWPKYAGNMGDEYYTENIKGSGNEDLGEPNMGYRYQYGDFDDVTSLLLREPFTRQAFLPIWFPEDTGVIHGDRVPCTIGYHFIRRFDYLHAVYYIRSCDFFRHFRDDIYLACRKVLWLIDKLRELDPDEWNDVKPGFLTMHITSLHCFAGEKSLLKK